MGGLGKFYYDKKVLQTVFCLKTDFQVTLVSSIVKCYDCAIDSDLKKWETEAVDIDMGGLGKFYQYFKAIETNYKHKYATSDLSQQHCEEEHNVTLKFYFDKKVLQTVSDLSQQHCEMALIFSMSLFCY